MVDREYELVRLQMREREREVRLMRLARAGVEPRPSALERLRQALGRALAAGEEPVKRVLEPDGTAACPEPRLVHRPWRDSAR